MSVKYVLASMAALAIAGCAGSGPVTLENTVAQQPNTGVRALSSTTYVASQPIVVSISVVPNNGTSAYAIEDQVPAGWSVTNINEGGVFDALTNKVKWGIYFDQCPTYFSYNLTPPATAAGAQALAGTLSVDGTNYALTGQSTVNP